MSSRSFAVLGLAVVLCSAGSGCVQYQATVACSYCNGDSSVVTGGWSCSQDGAVQSAADKCAPGVYQSTVDIESEVTLLCLGLRESFRQALLRSRPPAESCRVCRGLFDGIRQASQRVGLIPEAQEVEASDEPICPPQTVDMKVTVFFDVGSGCPTTREAQVQYYRKTESGQEYVTLSAMVAAGGNHEFICTDAKVEGGNVNSLWVAMNNNCSCSIDDGCRVSNSFIVPADGSSLVCHFDLAINVINSEIVPPPADATAALNAAPPKLVPIPDAMFSSPRR